MVDAERDLSVPAGAEDWQRPRIGVDQRDLLRRHRERPVGDVAGVEEEEREARLFDRNAAPGDGGKT